MNLSKCNKCQNLGLSFYAKHINPSEYIEGNPKAIIWIVGLNPKGDIGCVEERDKVEMLNFDPDSSSYFKDFRKVSSTLYNNWKSNDSKIAHTDLVKCFSNSFPPIIKENGSEKKIKTEHIVNNCSIYLQDQIKFGKPKILICNGSSVCQEIIRLFPPDDSHIDSNTITSYKTSQNMNGEIHSFWIILSGFIGRIDDRNKRRLGMELENILQIENIVL